MTRIDLTTSELHDLLTPVLPHASTDRDLPDLCVIHLEVRDSVLYAIATDRYTMAVVRHRLQDETDDGTIAISRVDAAALLKLFKYDRKTDPALQLTVGTVEAETILDPADRPALTVSAKDGNTLVLPGRESRTLADWRKYIGKVIHRTQQPTSPHLGLAPIYLPRWAKAARGAAPLMVSFGANATDPVAVRAGDHFIGIWMPTRLEERDARLADSPWAKEIPLDVDEPAEATPAPPVEEAEAALRAS